MTAPTPQPLHGGNVYFPVDADAYEYAPSAAAELMAVGGMFALALRGAFGRSVRQVAHMDTFVSNTTDDICAEAQKAAWLYDDINDACPYPFGTVAAATFRAAFEAAKASMVVAAQALHRHQAGAA